MSAPAPYPVRVEARPDPNLSRWLWLVKWLLAVPHYVVLAFLWFAFAVLSVAAFFAILVTGRYPRPIFEFNIGVLRWTWRVQYYGYAALGTDQYPPFTFGDVPEYPARLEVDYPEKLMRDYTTGTSALTTQPVVLTNPIPAVGNVRVRVTGRDPAAAVFVGIAPTAAVEEYLATVNHATIRDLSTGAIIVHSGSEVAVPPQDAGIRTARAAGTGTQTVTWPEGNGDWTVVVMNASGSAGLAVRAEAGATVPGLGWISASLLGTGAPLLAAGSAQPAVFPGRIPSPRRGGTSDSPGRC